MRALKATVRNGRLVLDEPTDIPNGTEVRLVAIDVQDEHSPNESVPSREERLRESAKKMMALHDETFRKLAK